MKKKINIKVFIGLVFLLLAVVIIISRLGIFSLSNILSYGKVKFVFGIILLLYCANGIVEREYENIFLSLAIILIMYRLPLGLQAFPWWLILIIAALLCGAFRLIFPTNMKSSLYSFNNIYPASKETDISDIRYDIFLGGGIKHLISEKISSAKLNCILGEMNVFFNDVKSESPDVDIKINLKMGQMVLYLPKNSTVESNLAIKHGELKENLENKEQEPKLVTFHLSGKVFLGTLVINYV